MDHPQEEEVIRALGPEDVAGLLELSRAVEWNQTAADWLRVMELEPAGCFGIAKDGRLVSTSVVTCYGRDMAWIGMVLTLPGFRGRGLARRLMERAVAYAESRGVAWLRLDATDMGRPLYTSLGFADEYAVERWVRPPGEAPETADVGPCEPDWAWDRAVFGADRSRLLRNLAAIESAGVPGEGYALGRGGSRAAAFGPCVCRTPEAARRLLGWFLSRHPAEIVYWDLAPHNREAVRLAEESGFTLARRLTRMRRRGVGGSEPVAERMAEIYALAGFEYG